MKHHQRVPRFLVAFIVAGATAASGVAQVSPPPMVYASGLEQPRGLKFGSDGYLYVAEGGTGGSNQTIGLCQQIPGPVGPYSGGATGRISKVDSTGNVTTVASGLPSAIDPMGDVLGVADLSFLNGQLYALLTGGGCSHGNPSLPNGVVRVDPTSGDWQYINNLGHVLQEHPPAYPEPADYEPDGSFYSMISKKGRLFIVEPNHGQIFATTPQGITDEIIDLSLSEGHIVPTSIAVRGDNLYVGNLGLFPIKTQAERILTLSRSLMFRDDAPGLGNTGNVGDFRIAGSRAGFTTIVGLEFGPDGLLYVLEYSAAAGYPTPGDGKVVRLLRDGTIGDVVTGLSFPTAMTFGPDGALYISNLGDSPGSAGQILRISVPLVFAAN